MAKNLKGGQDIIRLETPLSKKNLIARIIISDHHSLPFTDIITYQSVIIHLLSILVHMDLIMMRRLGRRLNLHIGLIMMDHLDHLDLHNITSVLPNLNVQDILESILFMITKSMDLGSDIIVGQMKGTLKGVTDSTKVMMSHLEMMAHETEVKNSTRNSKGSRGIHITEKDHHHSRNIMTDLHMRDQLTNLNMESHITHMITKISKPKNRHLMDLHMNHFPTKDLLRIGLILMDHLPTMNLTLALGLISMGPPPNMDLHHPVPHHCLSTSLNLSSLVSSSPFSSSLYVAVLITTKHVLVVAGIIPPSTPVSNPGGCVSRETIRISRRRIDHLMIVTQMEILIMNR